MTRVLIAIASYRRPDGLATLLGSIATDLDRWEHPPQVVVDVIVVDNDPAGSARRVAEASSLAPVYVVEPRPGIAAARNRAMQVVGGYDQVIFVDDDEFVEPGWFGALTTRAAESASGVITGPVFSTFPADAPRWLIRGGFIQRPVASDRAVLTAGATNNTLVKLSEWKRAGSPLFDESFSSTGGSDSKFFSVLLGAGVGIEFCSAARVVEPVLPERMRFRWVVRRSFRNGVVAGRIWAERHGGPKTFAKGIAMTGSGIVLMLRDLLLARGLQAPAFTSVLVGAGVVLSLTGARIHEYARPAVSGQR